MEVDKAIGKLNYTSNTQLPYYGIGYMYRVTECTIRKIIIGIKVLYRSN